MKKTITDLTPFCSNSNYTFSIPFSKFIFDIQNFVSIALVNANNSNDIDILFFWRTPVCD